LEKARKLQNESVLSTSSLCDISLELQSTSRPKPPQPFVPTIDQLGIFLRGKDQEIEQRLRPTSKPLPSELPPADEVKVKEILAKRGVVFKHAREQVTDKDLSRLQSNQWLNDEIINFYGSMILARSEKSKENPVANGVSSGKGKPLNAHYFSTFFWSKLSAEGYERGRLAKWTKKVGDCPGWARPESHIFFI
jgi:sentrin-specific protease 1